MEWMGILMLTHIFGDVGSGKTLLASYIASKVDKPIYANYTLKLPEYHDLKPEDLSKLKESTLVIVDEAYTWLESRLSGRNINLYMSYILFQSRKRGLDIILTDQLTGTIDLRFREMTNYEILCENIEHGFEYQISKISRFGNYRIRKLIMPYHTAEKIFPLFDSWQLIDPIDKNMLFNVTEDKGEIIGDVDKAANWLIEQFPINRITKGVVSDFCLRENIPKFMVDMIFNSIKVKSINESLKEEPKIKRKLEPEKKRKSFKL
jgi:hypothetical protein